MGEKSGWQDAGLPEPVGQSGLLRCAERLGHGERAGDQAGGGEGTGVAVHEPDDAEAGHRHADAAQ